MLFTYAAGMYKSLLDRYFIDHEEKMKKDYETRCAKVDRMIDSYMRDSYTEYIVDMWLLKGMTENQVLELMAIESETFK